jgi:RimJ/RimL family protein N-acetyltransferase
MPDVPPAATAPAVDTPRLALRGHTVADLDACAAMWADPAVTRHIGGRPASPEETWGRVLRYAGLWALLGYGYWAVHERASGRYAGDVGLGDFRRAMVPPLGGAPEVGWALAGWAQGQGFATEAVAAALAWADARLAAPRTACLIAPRNAASVRVAVKCGFVEGAPGEYRGEPTRVFWRPAGG